MATVLVVDDDAGVRAVADLVLTLTGNEVCDAANGLEALAVLSKRPVDLLVLDLEMPEMDGWTTFQEARREGYEGPILILSAHGAAKAARELGAEASVSKPFDPEELGDKALRLLADGRRDGANGNQDG